MVCFNDNSSNKSSYPVIKSIEEEQSSAKMTLSMTLATDSCGKFKQVNQFQKNKRVFNHSMNNNSNQQMFTSCCESKLAVIDVMILIAVVGAIGFLLYPYAKFTYMKGVEIGSLVFSVLEEEFCDNPVLFGSLGVSMVCMAMAACAIVICTSRKCGKPGCRGLWKAAEFDIKVETEDCVKNSNLVGMDGAKKGLFELPRDHHRELEAELKKIAPPNGRAVLVFRARCGCSVGRMEVPGAKKARKIKK